MRGPPDEARRDGVPEPRHGVPEQQDAAAEQWLDAVLLWDAQWAFGERVDLA